MSHKIRGSLLLLSAAAALTVAFGTGFRAETPRERASALLNEQVEVLGELYAGGASSDEIHAVVGEFDRRAERLLSELDDDERADLEAEIEAKVAGQLWGMN